MVQFRGISVSMISQHGIRKLPEYEPPTSADPSRMAGPTLRSENGSVASCYVPTYPGSQIWFDYSIETPHPPNAQYFFKLLCNGKVFTSWDLTAKYDYKGRTTYGLKYLGTHPHTGQPVVERQAFRFATEPSTRLGPFDDCVEVRVHRIEHRFRLALDAPDMRTDNVVAGENVYHDGFRIVNGGVLSPHDPKRHYTYQLLDAVDKPYATMRFYYRPLGFLIANGIVPPPTKSSRQTSTPSGSSRTSSEFIHSVSRSASKASSGRSPARSENSIAIGSSRAGTPPTDSVTAWLHHHRLQKYIPIFASSSFDTLVTLSDDDLVRLGIEAKGARTKLLREIAAYEHQHPKEDDCTIHEDTPGKEKHVGCPAPKAASSSPSSSKGTSQSSKSEYVGYCLGDPASDPSLQIVTKDSSENLTLPTPPGITLSAPPQKTIFTIENSPPSPPSTTARSAPADKLSFRAEEIKPLSPIKSPKKARKSLKVQINGVDFELENELEKERKGPLSPFTSGGMLRRLLGPTPPSAPARITAFGPTVDDEVGGMLAEMEAGRKEKEKPSPKRTTRAERGVGILSRILGKRIGRG